MQLETALTASSRMTKSLENREGIVVVRIERPSHKDVHLPDSGTYLSSLIACGCGLRVFIISSSDFKSRLSHSGALAI